MPMYSTDKLMGMNINFATTIVKVVTFVNLIKRNDAESHSENNNCLNFTHTTHWYFTAYQSPAK